jgi:hypothetical protein
MRTIERTLHGAHPKALNSAINTDEGGEKHFSSTSQKIKRKKSS